MVAPIGSPEEAIVSELNVRWGGRRNLCLTPRAPPMPTKGNLGTFWWWVARSARQAERREPRPWRRLPLYALEPDS